MKIEILGTSCPKCKKTVANAEKAVKELGVDAEIVKVEKINDILSYGVMVTPALAIDGDVKIAGKIPNPKQIAEWIKAYSEKHWQEGKVRMNGGIKNDLRFSMQSLWRKI